MRNGRDEVRQGAGMGNGCIKHRGMRRRGEDRRNANAMDARKEIGRKRWHGVSRKIWTGGRAHGVRERGSGS